MIVIVTVIETGTENVIEVELEMELDGHQRAGLEQVVTETATRTLVLATAVAIARPWR